MRENRRVILNGRDMAPPPFPGNPGTVVITKDKKGRLTDLVVNGQRVETELGTGQFKTKDKASQGQQVEIIRVVPPDLPGHPGFGFRDDEELGKRVEREVRRNFQFRGPEFEQRFNREFGERFGKEFNQRLNEQLDRSLRMPPAGPATTLRIQRDALRAAERGLREASTAKSLSAGQRQRISQQLAQVRAQLKATEQNALEAGPQRRQGSEGRDEELRDRQDELRERRQELQERIRESQRELRELEQGQAEPGRRGNEAPPAPPRPPRAVLEPLSPPALVPPAPPQPPRAPGVDTRALRNELRQDGLIGPDDKGFQLQLNGAGLTVNGKHLADEQAAKYRQLLGHGDGKNMNLSISTQQ
ncbi:MAG: hypothetical protein NVSMB30_28810 [Hymenobacter sp.]